MPTWHTTWSIRLEAEFGHHDLTPELGAFIAEAEVTTGLVTVQLVGSTGAITTIEYEPGALEDLARALEVVAPAAGDYAHNARWGDGNGVSHVRSALLKTGLTIPVVDGHLALGTWQQVVVLNLDTRARERQVVVVLMAE